MITIVVIFPISMMLQTKLSFSERFFNISLETKVPFDVKKTYSTLPNNSSTTIIYFELKMGQKWPKSCIFM